jgi:hypothetical protein
MGKWFLIINKPKFSTNFFCAHLKKRGFMTPKKLEIAFAYIVDLSLEVVFSKDFSSC